MTETELNAALLELERQRAELLPASATRRTGRGYRRHMKARKNDKLRQIVTRRYVPHAGYVDWAYVDGKWSPAGKYVKYPKNSNCQKWIKRETSRRIRNCRHVPQKGNFYRRLFDYWWTLY